MATKKGSNKKAGSKGSNKKILLIVGVVVVLALVVFGVGGVIKKEAGVTGFKVEHEEGDKRCSANRRYVEIYQGSWIPYESCAYYQICSNGECKGVDCTAGDFGCNGDVAENCVQLGEGIFSDYAQLRRQRCTSPDLVCVEKASRSVCEEPVECPDESTYPQCDEDYLKDILLYCRVVQNFPEITGRSCPEGTLCEGPPGSAECVNPCEPTPKCFSIVGVSHTKSHCTFIEDEFSENYGSKEFTWERCPTGQICEENEEGVGSCVAA